MLYIFFGVLFYVEVFELDMYVFIDMMFDKLVIQLCKYCEKVCDKYKVEVCCDDCLYG